MATPAVLHRESPLSDTRVRLPRPQRIWIQGLLLLITLFTTTMVGMRYMWNFQHDQFPLASDADIFPFHWMYQNLRHFSMGLPFSLTLLGILLVHEFGHYFTCRHYGVRASLPYLLPAPSLSGTAGAVIRLRTRVKSRAALLSIGAIGPIAGFVVAVIMACVGLALSKPLPAEPGKLVIFNSPLLLTLLNKALTPVLHLPPPHMLLWHPVYVAAWIGVLITSLNLLPCGQLDGGHILYSLSPRIHRATTYIVMGVLALLGIFAWIGWLLWVGLLCLPGMRHPRIEDTAPLPKNVLWLAPVALVLLVLTMTPQPFSHSSALNLIQHSGVLNIIRKWMHH